MKKFYITTAIDYVNGKPHIGHTLEKIQADAAARFHKQQGDDVYFLTGTDEHGAKIARAAEKAKKPIRTFVSENAKAFKKLWRALDIDFNYFIRTSNQKTHWPTVRAVWKRLEKNGDIYKKEYRGLYCYGHEAFVTEKDLKNGECEIHGAPPEVVEEENYFFRLSKYTNDIASAIKKGEMKIIPKERENEIMNLLEQGLDDVSFSRPRKDLKWGVPVPGDTTQTMYVWADALSNYISALGWGTKDDTKFKKYWPADVHVIGKDILRFHAAIWPGMLLSLGLPLPRSLFVHGFISVEGKKMSKSLGNVIDPHEIIEKYASAEAPRAGSDALRWYLLAEIPSTRDGDYSQEKFESRYNADLALGLGNFLSRVVGLGERHLERSLKSTMRSATERELSSRMKSYNAAMEKLQFADAIRQIQKLIAFGDKRINDIKLWELANRDNKDRFEKEIADLATLLAYIAWLAWPFIPNATKEIARQLGVDLRAKRQWKFTMKKRKPLFPRLS